MTTAVETTWHKNSGMTEREIDLSNNHAGLTNRRRDHDRIARTPKHRRELLEARVAIAKRAKAIQADKKFKADMALAETAIEAAQREFTEANEPFIRLQKAKDGLHNCRSRRDGIENSHRAELIKLGRESDTHVDFVLADIIGELQIALDAAMGARTGPGIERTRATLKSALEVAMKMPYEFIGSWIRYEAILANLRALAQSRGSDAAASEQWNSADIFEPVELDGAGK